MSTWATNVAIGVLSTIQLGFRLAEFVDTSVALSLAFLRIPTETAAQKTRRDGNGDGSKDLLLLTQRA